MKSLNKVIGFKSTVHLWRIYNQKILSLTNHDILSKIENQSGFDLNLLIKHMIKVNKYEPDNIPNGFLFIDHATLSGNFIEANGWNKKVEEEFVRRGYISKP